MTDSAHHNDGEKKVFIIKKIVKKKGHGHHGGSWKIAYADFVTAMMAFFLLMWLLSLMNKYQLMGISEYFNRPLKQAFTAQSMKEQQLRLGGKDRYLMAEKPSGPSQYHGAEHVSRMMNTREVSQSATGMTNSDAQKSMALDQKSLEAIKEKMLKDIDKNPIMKQYKNMLNFIVTADGLKIELHDLQNKPMFSQGKTDFAKYSKIILNWLANELNQYPRRVAVIGHTDSAQYETQDYTNWELSADRANATRRALIQNGMAATQIVRIIGMGDTDPLNKTNGLDPANRRIDIFVLSDEAYNKLLH